MNKTKSDRIHIIAEMACSHEGDPELGRKIIDAAGAAGADAIQFQIWKLSDIVVPYHPNFQNMSKLEMSREQWASLVAHTRDSFPQMNIIACVNDRKSVDFCQKVGVDAYKLHSSDLSNPYMLEYVAKTEKRIDLSVGASTIEEIQNALHLIQSTSEPEIWLMYGHQNFPTPTDSINLNFMKKISRLFELPIGYQDHSDGNSDAAFWLPAVALGIGVQILEKHITHDRSQKGADYESALNPDEFFRFVKMVREIEKAKGCSIPKRFSDEELKYRKYSKKSIVAARDLPKGHLLKDIDLLFMRTPEPGLPPDQSARLIGAKTNSGIKAFNLIQIKDIL